jgi:hypothetical protein
MRPFSPTILRPADEGLPFGEVALPPSAMTGLSEAQLARAIIEDCDPDLSDESAEELTRLRRAFPHSPLTYRLSALAAIGRR